MDFCRKMNLKVMGVVENMSGYQCPCCQVRPSHGGFGVCLLGELFKYSKTLLNCLAVPISPLFSCPKLSHLPPNQS